MSIFRTKKGSVYIYEGPWTAIGCLPLLITVIAIFVTLVAANVTRCLRPGPEPRRVPQGKVPERPVVRVHTPRPDLTAEPAVLGPAPFSKRFYSTL